MQSQHSSGVLTLPCSLLHTFIITPMQMSVTPIHLQDGSGILCYQIQCLREIVLICMISKIHGAFYLKIIVCVEPGLLAAESKLPSINSTSPGRKKTSNCCKLFLLADRRRGQGTKYHFAHFLGQNSYAEMGIATVFVELFFCFFQRRGRKDCE